jgi:hypothetical protein
MIVGFLAVLAIAGLFGVANGVAGIESVMAQTVASSSSPSNSTYVLTLVITTDNTYNSSIGQQPAYYIVGPNGLESSANITVPSDQPIELVIVDYDDGSATLTVPQDANVTGVPGGIFVVSNTNVNSSQGPSGIEINESSLITQVPPSLIAHTFTVSGLLNIPVEMSSTTIANFTLTTPGTYAWSCNTECGSGPNGTAGPMNTPGWMEGSLVVLPPQSSTGQAAGTLGLNSALVIIAVIGAALIGTCLGILLSRPRKNQQ